MSTLNLSLNSLRSTTWSFRVHHKPNLKRDLLLDDEVLGSVLVRVPKCGLQIYLTGFGRVGSSLYWYTVAYGSFDFSLSSVLLHLPCVRNLSLSVPELMT